MFNLTKTFTNESKNFKVTPIKMGEDLIFLSQEIESQLGFENLSKNLRNSLGYIKDVDYIILDGDKLRALKDLVKDSATVFAITSSMNRLTVITESGLYALILKSKKPECVQFRIWLTSEVIPEIRKTGSYLPETIRDNPLVVQAKQMMEITVKYALLEEKQNKLELKQKEQVHEIEEIKAKQDAILDQSGFYSILAYSKFRKVRVDRNLAGRLGKRATQYSKEIGARIGTVPDPRYLTVQTYHKDVLELVFNEFGL